MFNPVSDIRTPLFRFQTLLSPITQPGWVILCLKSEQLFVQILDVQILDIYCTVNV